MENIWFAKKVTRQGKDLVILIPRRLQHLFPKETPVMVTLVPGKSSPHGQTEASSHNGMKSHMEQTPKGARENEDD